MSKPFNLLLSCVGRRVALLNAFRRAFARLGLDGRIIGTDSSPLSAALQLCDRQILLPSCRSDSYLPQLLDVCRREKVDLVVPLIDTELQLLADHHADFRAAGATLCLSSPEVVAACTDKRLTYRRLCAAGVDTPRVFDDDEITPADFPLFMKPCCGSAARDTHRIADRAQLDFFRREVPDAIVQELLDGREYTLDIFNDFQGRPLCVVPRQRLEVRTGEVTKSITVLDADLIRLGLDAARALPGCCGPITAQCFHTAAGRRAVIEINPRLGGGVPLAIEAGADFPTWTIECALGRTPSVDLSRIKDRLVMLRYDEAVFVQEELAQMITALAWDMDDTLYLEREFVRSGFRAADACLRQRVDPDRDWFADLWRDFQAGVRGQAFDRVLTAAGAAPTADLLAELIRVYRSHQPDIALCPDVPAALAALNLPPDRLGLITDGPVEMQRRKFDALGLAGRLKHLFFTDAWGLEFRKPHHRAFLEFEQLAGCRGRACAYVADNPAKDFRAPHELGWTTIRLRRPAGLHAAAPAVPGEVDRTIADLGELADALKTIERNSGKEHHSHAY